MKRVLAVLTVLALVVLVSGCTSKPIPPNIEFFNVKIIPPDSEYYSIGTVTGIIENTGGQTASYVEIGVKFYDSNDVVVASGWTNFANVLVGEKREFTISVLYFPGTYDRYKLHWSLSPGGAM